MMQDYEDDIDEYGEYEEAVDELEEEAEDEDVAEYEEEEERPPTKEELEYLELRQRLKESIRKKMKKENGAARMNSLEKKRKLPYDDFGSFFGPSKPVISSRVIQESKSLLENQQLTSRLLNSRHPSKKTVPSGSSASKNGLYDKRPKYVNEHKRKVEKLKDTRDYSFLLSDDVEFPTPSRVPPSRSIPALNSEARSAALATKSSQPLGINGRSVHSGCEEKKRVSLNGLRHLKSGSSGSQMHSKPGSSGSQTLSKTGSSGSQKAGSLGSRMHSKPSSTNNHMHSKPSSADKQMHYQSGTPNGQVGSKLGNQKPAPITRDSTPTDARKQLGRSNGFGPGRLVGTKSLPSKNPNTTVEKKAFLAGTKNPLHGAQKPPSSKMQASDAKQRFEQRNFSHEPYRPQMVTKLSTGPTRPQINRPVKQATSCYARDDHRPKKKKPMKMSEDDLALSMIRQMFKTDRYAGCGYDDDDDSDMEANFDDIMMEEQRSARIAAKEDEEQLRLIEEEERRERMRKMAKKRRLSHR